MQEVLVLFDERVARGNVAERGPQPVEILLRKLREPRDQLPPDLRHHAVTFVFLLLCRLFLKAEPAQRARRVELEPRRDAIGVVEVFAGQLFGLGVDDNLVFAHGAENDAVGVESGKERGCDVDGGERAGFGGEGLGGEE